MLSPHTVDQMLTRSHTMGLGDPEDGDDEPYVPGQEQGSVHHQVGHRVKTPKGHGTVASVHHNTTFYGVHMGSGVAYFPSTQVEPANDDVPGQADPDEGIAGTP